MKKESEDSGPTQNFLRWKLWEGEAGELGRGPQQAPGTSLLQSNPS